MIDESRTSRPPHHHSFFAHPPPEVRANSRNSRLISAFCFGPSGSDLSAFALRLSAFQRFSFQLLLLVPVAGLEPARLFTVPGF
jgi:hypothetical protein